MASLQDLTGKDYLSYSALTSWLGCGERFRLERVLGAPQSEAWWFIAGDAIHKATEDADLDGCTDPGEAVNYFMSNWNNSMARLAEAGIDKSTIKAGGRVSRDWPNREDGQFWLANGPGMVAGWIKWRANAESRGWKILDIDGKPAIEVPVEFSLNDTLVKGYIDRVMVNPNGEVIVVDLKSGSRQPASSLQLGVYAAGLADNHGVTAQLGAYYMTRKNDLTEVVSLLHYSRDALTDWFTAAQRGIEAEVFIPNVSPLCGTCSVSPYCVAVGGKSPKVAFPKP